MSDSKPTLTTRQGHPVYNNQQSRTVSDRGPATLENLSEWIWNKLENSLEGLAMVTVLRDSNGERCAYSKTGS